MADPTPTTALPTALVLLPTYNERENLPTITSLLLAQPNVRVLVIDDGSPDGTGADRRRDRDGERRPPVGDAPHRQARAGPSRTSTASRAALATDADLVCQMDADLSHDPKYLPDLVRGRGRKRRRHRLALPAGRQRRQLAAATPHAQPVRQLVHPHRHRPARPRLHGRVTAAGGARRSAGCRSTPSSPTATRSWSRRCSWRWTPGCAVVGGADHLRRAPAGRVEDLGRRHPASRCFTPWRWCCDDGSALAAAGSRATIRPVRDHDRVASPGQPQRLLSRLQRQRHDRAAS